VRTWLGVLLVLPCTALAGDAREDYGWGWPLEPESPGRGAYRVELTPAIYERAQHPALRDIDVINVDGEPVPAAVMAAVDLESDRVERVELPWYRVPPPAERSGSGWRMRAQTDARGRLLNVETEVTEEGARVPPATDILVDASGLRRPLRALLLEWPPGAGGDLEVMLGVATSHDLVNWRQRVDSARLVDLVNDDRRLMRNRIDLGGVRASYLRLQPRDRGGELALDSVLAEYTVAPADVDWQWVTLAGQRGNGDDGTSFVYELGGRFPVERLALRPGPGSAAEWTAYSRDSDAAPWRRRAGPWVAFRVASDTGERGSGPRDLGAATRDRYWRITTTDPVRQAPELRLGYRPEVVVFLPRGSGPYTLVAGSARSERRDAPVREVLARLRAGRQTSWSPATARLGPMRTLAGAAALEQRKLGPDWTTWLLWAVLVCGAALIAGLAVRLLRRAEAPRMK